MRAKGKSEKVSKVSERVSQASDAKVRSAMNVTLSFVFFFVFVTFVSFVSSVLAENIIIIEYGPGKTLNESCSIHYQCTSWLCLNGVCASCSSNDDCNETTLRCVGGNCVPCTSDRDCSTLWCSSGNCRRCTRDIDCPSGLCNEVTGNCYLCTSPNECSSGYCDNGYCKFCTSDSQCVFGICSGGNCRSCKDVGCPAGLKCNEADGKCYCKDVGESCEFSSQCCSGRCTGGKCTVVLFERGTIQHPSRSAAGSSSSASGELRVVREVERKTTSPVVTSIFGWTKKKIETYATCIRGARCGTSDDCCGAECVDGYCLCSTLACTSSGECCNGYCENGLCVQPPTTSLFISEALKRPVNAQVGCAGLIEECLPGEQSCISICNALTGVLALVAIGSGAFVWRKIGHPVPGIVGALVPVGIGLITYPFVGTIVGLIIIAFITRV